MPSQEHINKTIKYFNPGTGCPGGCLEAMFGVKDEVYDSMLKETLNSLDFKKFEINKIGLDEDELQEIAPIYFHGYEHDGARWRIGKDGRLRTSKYSATWLFFSGTQVYAYQYILDMASNDKKERTEEYFYKDVTNFSTTTETVGEGNQKREINEFAIIVPGDRFKCSISGVPDADRSISAMKQKLREKKG